MRTVSLGQLRASLLLLAVTVIMAPACTPKKPDTGPDPGQAQALWNAFTGESGGQVKALSLSASLSVQHPQKSARLLARFWGNLDRPLRLDLSTGAGQTFALWREDSLGWLAVYPTSNQAFTHQDTKAALARLGIPFPFGLKELAAVCAGRFGGVVGTKYASVKRTAKGFEYALPASSAVGGVTLDFEGKPIHLTGRGVEPWSVELGDFAPLGDGGRLLAQRITVTSPGGLQAVLRVKKLELLAQPVEAPALELALPPGARHVPLDRGDDFKAPEMP